MARKRPAKDEAREASRRMTPSEDEAQVPPRPGEAGGDSLLAPRPATGRMLQDLAGPPDESETERAAKRAAQRARRKG